MSRHRASSMINIYGTNYCADHTNGNLYEYSPDIYTDNGDPIVKQRDTAVIHGGLFGTPGKRLSFNSVTFNIVSGYEDMSAAGAGALAATPPLPDPSAAEAQIEIVAPFWENTGNWIDLSALTQTTFATMFGVAVDGADFNAAFTVDQAAIFNTSDSGNKMQIQDSVDCTHAALYITDKAGYVVDSMIYANVPNGDSVVLTDAGEYNVPLGVRSSGTEYNVPLDVLQADGGVSTVTTTIKDADTNPHVVAGTTTMRIVPADAGVLTVTTTIKDSDGNSHVVAGTTTMYVIPSDAIHYVVITSDTGTAKIKKWDSSP